jgi:hypothetical protein
MLMIDGSAPSRSLRFCLFAVALCVAAGGLPSAVIAADEEIVPAKFLKEYRAALARQSADRSRFRIVGQMHQVFDKLDGNPPTRDLTLELESGHDGLDREFRSVYPGKDSFELTIITPHDRRPFAVRRDQVKGPYQLKYVDKIPSNLSWLEMFTVYAACSVNGENLTPLAESDRFTVNKSTKTNIDGRDVVRVDFAYRPIDPKSQYDMKGELVLDPANDHAILSYSVKRAIPDLVLEITGSARYSDKEGCRLLPEEAKSRQFSRPTPTRQFETRHEFRAETISSDPPPDSTFRAAYYGLVDLDSPRSRPGNYSAYWAFGVGALALVLMFVLRRLAR